MTPTTVLCECIVQRRYLFFVKLCFDNIMSIIMKVSYMKSNNREYRRGNTKSSETGNIGYSRRKKNPNQNTPLYASKHK